MSIVTPNTGDGNISYNFNKYCIDADKNIYTRYYYTDLKVGTEIQIGDYWLYKPNATWPNSGTTNFVESVRVILGGGGTFWKEGKTDFNIGSISCN